MSEPFATFRPGPVVDPLDQLVRRDLLATFRTRLVRDSSLVLVGHGLLIAVVLWVMIDDAPVGRLLWWIGALVLVTISRALWQARAARPTLTDRGLLRGLRSLTVLQGVTWGVGTAFLGPLVSADDLTVVLVCLGGLIASAGSMLDSDEVSMRLYVASILGPIVGGQLLGSTENGLLLAVVIALFGFVTLLLHSRAHDLLEDGARGRILLEASYREIGHDKAYLEGLLRGAPLAVAVLDAAKRVRFVNRRFEQLFGYSSEELSDRVLSDLLVPKAGIEAHERILQGIGTGKVQHADVERVAKDGRLITVRISASAVTDPSAPGTVVMYEDITHERETQAKLQERERRLSRLVDANILGIAFWEMDGTITEANDEYLRIVDRDRGDLEARRVNFRTMIPPEEAELTEANASRLRAGLPVPPWESNIVRPDGTTTPAILAIAPLTDGRDKGVCFVLDIAIRREAQRQLARKTALLEAQLSSTLDGILVVDADGRSVLTNRQMAEMWHLPPEVFADPDDRRRLDFVVGQTSDPAAFLAKVEHLYAHPGETSRDELALKDGTIFDRYSAPVLGPEGEHYGRIWTFRDITVTKQATRTLEAARALAEQTAENRAMFLANMSHEIRTPMNAVLGMLELVLESDLTSEQRHYLSLASTSAESLLGVLNDVLDYSKIGAGRIDLEEISFDLQKVIHGAAALLAGRAAERGIELVVDVTPGTPRVVRGDPARFRQVLTNLMGNAIKFTERGEVVVTAAAAPLSDGRPGVRISVRDTGIGMTPDQVEHLFEAFTQGDGSTHRRFGGTGLGLAISDQLVTLMHGTITATSTPGAGSEFTLALPFASLGDTTPPAPSTREALAEQVIVVVDDNPINRHLLDRMLTAAGARVVEAESAREALVQFRRIRQAGVERVLGILDGRMPEVDGFELARQIRADPELSAIPLLMLTSSGQRGDAARCRELGVPGYLTKPVSQSDLLDAVAAILHGEPVAGPGGEVITKHSMAEARVRLTLLVAEDNPVNQEVAARMLRNRGHHVDLAANGREAVAAVRRTRYDAVLMDIQMPEVDGYEATAQIRALPEGKDLPIIALTAHAYGEERDRCLAAGMNGFVTKPFKARELFAAVEGARLNASQSPAAESAPSPALRAPAVDLAGFREELRKAGVESALEEILDTFLEGTPARSETLHEALLHGTPSEVGSTAHALKGSAAAIGARGLATLLGQIEGAGEHNTLTEREHLAEEVEAGVAAVMAEVRGYRAHEG